MQSVEKIAGSPADAEIKTIRVRTADSAYTYFILESYEGVMAYSTLPHSVGDPYRDLELQIPVSRKPEAEALLARLATELGDGFHGL